MGNGIIIYLVYKGKLEKLVTVLGVSRSTCEIYSLIKRDLKRKGKPIPENDIWIAAITIENQCQLVTRDKHFDEVERLTCINW